MLIHLHCGDLPKGDILVGRRANPNPLNPNPPLPPTAGCNWCQFGAAALALVCACVLLWGVCVCVCEKNRIGLLAVLSQINFCLNRIFAVLQ